MLKTQYEYIRRLLNAAAPNADSDLWWLTSLIFGEVGKEGEGFKAKLAVAWVVRNRITVNKKWDSTQFHNTIKGVIRQVANSKKQFDAYQDNKWKRAMEYHRDPEIHKNATFKKEDISDPDRLQLFESLQAAYLVMEHPESNPDPTIGGLDGVGATFFAGSIDGPYKTFDSPVAMNDRKDNPGLGSHVFWDRSLEWWFCNRLSFHVGSGTVVPPVCFHLFSTMEQGAEADRLQEEEVLREGLESLRKLRHEPASIN